jgi:hypothetical protein
MAVRSAVPRMPVTVEAERYRGNAVPPPRPIASSERWVSRPALLTRLLRIRARGLRSAHHPAPCVGELSRNDLPTRRATRPGLRRRPLAQSLGADRLQLALLPLGADGAEDAAIAAAWEDVSCAAPGGSPGDALAAGGRLALGPAWSSRRSSRRRWEGVICAANATADPVHGRWHLPFIASTALRSGRRREPEPVPLEVAAPVGFTAGPGLS